MIDFYNQVPSIYTNASRDFQYISWLINIVLNSVKHNVDDMYALPNGSVNDRLAEILALTLGFKIKRNYDQKQLIALVAVLPRILRYKGTLRAVELAAETLLTASGARGAVTCTVAAATLTIVLPKGLIDTTLFLDLLAYILPAGMSCRVIRKTELKPQVADIDIEHSDKLYCGIYDDLKIDNGESTGLATLYDVPASHVAEFMSNFTKLEGDEYKLNTGLFSNTVIPVLANATLKPNEGDDVPVLLYSTEKDGTHKLLQAADHLLGVTRKKGFEQEF